MIPFWKYHGLGNDYIVVREADAEAARALEPDFYRRICDRHFGIGSDGVLVDRSHGPRFALSIVNPDGSEAEKSGNGLRIFARYLWDLGFVGEDPFVILTAGGEVRAEVRDDAAEVRVEMGRASFSSRDIPVAGPEREVLAEPFKVGGRDLEYSAVTVGNPHCVLFGEDFTPEQVRRLGPQIERDPRFPNRTNVQFVTAASRERLAIQIWERGAGYTLASGSSSCAAAAVAHRLGRVGRKVTVVMPGGALGIEIGAGYELTMTGPVTAVARGQIEDQCWRQRPAMGA